jgi:PAS domain S-box-containing protein
VNRQKGIDPFPGHFVSGEELLNRETIMTPSFQAFRSLIEHSPDAISVIDLHGTILYGSASTTKIFGYQREEFVGRNCLELIHPEDRADSIRALQEVLATPGPLKWEARIHHKDGSYCWVESTVSNLLSEAEVRAIVVHQRDIHTRRAAEEERRQQAEELARCNERLEEFAHAAAHDLREPLRAISAYTELLLREVEMDATAKEMAKFIVDGTGRMSKLIDNLLSFAAAGKYDPSCEVDLEDAVAQAIANLELEIKTSGANITMARLPVVPGNEIELVRLFQNLIGNAAKYRGKESPVIHVFAEQHGSDWVIGVKDNGVGIAAENHDRVFLPFVRLAERDVSGTGLGLAVCKKIVEELAGTIWVESTPGAGSTFFFTIAAAENSIARPMISYTASV